jgi:hypothetical protein
MTFPQQIRFVLVRFGFQKLAVGGGHLVGLPLEAVGLRKDLPGADQAGGLLQESFHRVDHRAPVASAASRSPFRMASDPAAR